MPLVGESDLQNLRDVWTKLDLQRRVFLVGAAIMMLGAVALLARGAGQPEMSLLFGGLDGQVAGDVVTALDQQGTPYEVRGNAIYVPTNRRDLLRMNLAGQGLPATGSRGYELLDELSGFTTTAQMFDAAYWRAREGELARTIVASPHIQAARVHISTSTQRPFQRDQQQTAAVTVTAQGRLAAEHVRALQFLVAAAVPQLVPADVAVIDDEGSLLSESDADSGATATDARADALRARAERLLEARVGPGNAVVEVSIDATTQSEQIRERLVDTDSRIAISTEITESSGTSNDTRGAAVTVASNLPDGDAGGQSGNTSNENSESRTLTNFDVSETERQTIRGPGEIRRLTVAVLVNEVPTAATDGNTATTPRTEEELAALRELVASAVGIDDARGDVLTLKSMPFEPLAPKGTEAISGSALSAIDIMQVVEVAALAIVALVLGLFVLRPILTSQTAPAPASAGTDSGEDLAGPPMAMAMDSASLDGFMEGDFGGPGNDEGDAASRLRQMISDRQPETLRVLEDWIADSNQERKAS